MKIAFFVYPSAFQNKGGGEVLLERIEKYLNKREGLEVKRFDMWNDQIENFDILHVFGSVKDCLDLMQTAKAKGVKVVLESIFWSSFQRAFCEEGSIFKKFSLAARHAMKLVCPVFPSARRKMFQTADIIFPNSLNEAKQIARLFAVPRKKMFVVPNGVDIAFCDVPSGPFTEEHKLKDFVLSVGRIEPRKNQLNLIRAMKGVDRDLVLIGETVSGYQWYYEKCKNEADNKVHFLGAIPHGTHIHMSSYAACDCFVLPGWFETPGLAALEAALAGAKVVATSGGSTKEYFLDKVSYIDPKSPSDIRNKIREALNSDRDKNLRDFVINKYTWDKVVDKVIEGYKLVLR